MAPKFRGDSDDWLDDEEDRKETKASSRGKATDSRAQPLPADQANGTVAEVFPNQCRVRFDSGGEEIVCSYKRTALFSSNDGGYRERSPVAVGDRVRAESTGAGSGIVLGLCQRRNFLSRPAPGGEDSQQRKLIHVIAANVDTLVIVASVDAPRFAPGLVDRFLVAAEAGGIEPILCVTKTDLPGSERPWTLYQELGYSLFEVSARAQLGMDALEKAIVEKSVVFCGHSGVGKTSLLRVLLNRQFGKIGEVNASTGKGKHTTTGALLLTVPSDVSPATHWIDTPGIREFGFLGVTGDSLRKYFPEFRALPCTALGCTHTSEVACSARVLPRYPSYLRIFESLADT